MVSYGEILSGLISAIVWEFYSLACYELGNNIKSVSNAQSDVLVLWCMVDGVFSDEFKRVVAVIFFEDPDCALGEWNTKALCLGVVELNFASNLETILAVTTWTDWNLIIFSDFYSVDFWNKFHLLLRGLV